MELRSRRTVDEDPTIPGRPGWEGMHVWWLGGRPEGATRLVVNETEFPPGRAHEIHRHPGADEAIYILAGTGLHLRVGDGPVRVVAGDLVMIPAGEWHGLANDSDQPLRLLGLFGGVGSYAEAGYDIHPDQPETP